ncbi:MAG: hypothetical protein HC774_00185 [Sphingomonadales bacterium]|nr:hypothetical protein [Sphingomonadales bacterium]
MGKEPFEIIFSIGAEYDFKAMAVVGEQIYEFGRKLIETRPGYFTPEISVFKRGFIGGEPERVSTFRINEESLQYRMGMALPISDTLIGLQGGTEHPHLSSLTIFDVTRNQPVGYVPYSELQFLPAQKALRVAEPLTRAMDTPAAVEEARRGSRIIPILQDGKLNPELAESELFGGPSEAVANVEDTPKPSPVVMDRASVTPPTMPAQVSDASDRQQGEVAKRPWMTWAIRRSSVAPGCRVRGALLRRSSLVQTGEMEGGLSGFRPVIPKRTNALAPLRGLEPKNDYFQPLASLRPA